LDKRQGFSVSNLKIVGNDKYFYLKGWQRKGRQIIEQKWF
jgi:hypothetical protein